MLEVGSVYKVDLEPYRWPSNANLSFFYEKSLDTSNFKPESFLKLDTVFTILEYIGDSYLRDHNKKDFNKFLILIGDKYYFLWAHKKEDGLFKKIC